MAANVVAEVLMITNHEPRLNLPKVRVYYANSILSHLI